MSKHVATERTVDGTPRSKHGMSYQQPDLRVGKHDAGNPLSSSSADEPGIASNGLSYSR